MLTKHSTRYLKPRLVMSCSDDFPYPSPLVSALNLAPVPTCPSTTPVNLVFPALHPFTTLNHRLPCLTLRQGHVHNMARNFPEALSEYFHAYRFLPNEPLLLMCIGVTFLNLATGRKVPDRNRAVLQGFAFLQVNAGGDGARGGGWMKGCRLWGASKDRGK